mmetsp:Transcript_13174/g.25906  ORF Transcript_13174/g.25906 Transcript_13174/m.25906 type:complete len:162 (-) Transcript_13174:812-1297(-)
MICRLSGLAALVSAGREIVWAKLQRASPSAEFPFTTIVTAQRVSPSIERVAAAPTRQGPNRKGHCETSGPFVLDTTRVPVSVRNSILMQHYRHIQPSLSRLIDTWKEQNNIRFLSIPRRKIEAALPWCVSCPRVHAVNRKFQSRDPSDPDSSFPLSFLDEG